jgi:hypothetical protein
MNSKFNIGDKVRVVTTYIYPNNITRLEYIDKKMTIKELLKHGDYKVEENNYGWKPNDLELIEQDTKEDTPKASCNKCIRPPYTSSKIDYDCEDCKISLLGKTVLDVEDGTRYHSHNQEPITDPTCGLDYKAEYNRLLEEHEELKELHEIALMMIKLGSELI